MELRNVELADSILNAFRRELGGDFVRYRNHVIRVLQFSHLLAPCGEGDWDKLQIAAVFHDLGIWTASTLDYLEPSVALAANWLAQNGRGEWQEEVAAIIRDHHKVLKSNVILAEVMRKADWMDVTLGLIHHGIPRKALRSAYRLFPDEGFHRMLARLFASNLVRHPLHPLPMMRW